MAHRGQTHNAPEITLESFEDAIKTGFNWIELDLVTTRDGTGCTRSLVVAISYDVWTT